MYIQKFVRKAARIGQLDLYMWCALRTHKWRRVLLMYVLHTCLAYVLHICLACVLVCQQSSGLFNRQVSPPKKGSFAKETWQFRAPPVPRQTLSILQIMCIIYIYIYIHIYIYIYIYIYMYIIYIYIYRERERERDIHIYIYIYIYIYIIRGWLLICFKKN